VEGRCDGSRLASAASAALGEAPLRINEVMTANDGAWVDEAGETDDFIELMNTGDEPIQLASYLIGEKPGGATALPARVLAPQATVIVWADDDVAQGALHLPFKLAREGATVLLWSAPQCELVDRVDVPSLPPSESYARLPDGSGHFTQCRYATPDRANGERCEPPPPPNLVDGVSFADFTLPTPFPAIAGPLVISELALRPAAFVEVLNASDEPVSLAEHSLRLAPSGPGVDWPGPRDGAALAWPVGTETLAPHARALVPVTSPDTAAIAASADFEGVVTLFHASDAAPSDRIAFLRWPEGAVLTRMPDASGYPRFCRQATPGAENDDCDPLPSRDVGDRVHDLQTPHDFDALAEGGTELGEEGVKFVVDMNAGDTVHLLGTRDWALHYTWIRERVYGQPRLDRCDPAQALEFDQGWGLFSQDEYFRVDGRRFLLGTLVRHVNGSKTVEFTPGDAIDGEQMRRAFFAVMSHVDDPSEWKIRPTEARQLGVLRSIEGSAPIVGPNAPFASLTYQPLTAAVGFGVLRFVPASELESAELGPNVIVVTDDVPNGSAFMGGLITEAFQTPLAHVNVLARARNTPNMALRSAENDPRVEPLLGQLVRLEVRASDFELRAAMPEEADQFWQARKPTGPKLVPARDLSVRGIVPLDTKGYADSISVGSKAAGIAELYRVASPHAYCGAQSVPLYVPPDAFAVPFAHYVDHFKESGAEALLAELERDPAFRADPEMHAQGLAQVRDKILAQPVDPALASEVSQAVATRFGNAKVRFRSSSNTEDLATFNGAGLHTSTSADIDGSSTSVENALRIVWSSLWNTRAYDERDFGNVDQSLAAMAVLVHVAWQSEAAQGVAISRNAVHATRADQYYINAQIGEASVTNPAPGVTADEMVYTPPPRTPQADYRSHSSLSPGKNVLTFQEVQNLGCALGAIHDHFQPLVDPNGANRLYAMQIEWKLIGAERRLLVKQARPYTFGSLETPADCREF
jgi:hypothetical protein